MSSPDRFFCRVLERQYDGYVALINTALLLTPQALRLVKSNILFYERFVLDVIDNNLLFWEDKILALFELIDTETLDRLKDTRMAFCRTAYACEAIREALFPSTGESDPTWVNVIPETVRNQLRITSDSSTYEVFEQFVCKLSLRKLLDNFRNLLMDDLEALLDKWLAQLGLNKIDEFIQAYFDALGDTGIFDALAKLDQFAQCFFEACNFVETAGNFKDDTAEKLALEQVGNGWQFRTLNYVTSAKRKEADIRNRISKLRTQAIAFRSNTTAGDSGISEDEVMK